MSAYLIGVEDEELAHVRRELANCSVVIETEFATPAQAIDAVRRTRGERRLLVYRIASSRAIESLSHLTKAAPGWPVLGLIGNRNDPAGSIPADLIGFLRAGVSQFVNIPPTTQDVLEALDRIVVQFVHGDSRSASPSVIAVGGVTGGCGTTTLAINLADSIVNDHGLRCILVDLSLRMGVVATYLDIEAPFSILDLIRDMRRLDTLIAERSLINTMGGFKLLAGPSTLAAPVSISANDFASLLSTLSQITDVVVLDVPCTYDDLYFEALAAAGRVVLIGEQSLPSVRALRLVHDAIVGVRKGGHAAQVVINRFDPKNSVFSAARLVEPIGVSSLLTISRDDASFKAAMHNGCSLRIAAPRSPATTDIAALTATLLGTGLPSPSNSAGVVGRIRRALSRT